MKVKVLSEFGYEEAALGFSLSYNTTIERAKQVMPHYAFGVPGENKFLESMMLWVDVTAPRNWWQEMDTYRTLTKQSESTMHTITKKPLGQENFELPILPMVLDSLNEMIASFRAERTMDLFFKIKNDLPEGFLQRRIMCLSYKTLQNMYVQRISHRYKLWEQFLEEVLGTIEYPEFIRKEKSNENE